jgi:hypothetical protein
MPLYKNCGQLKNFDCIFGFSAKRYVRNTINLSWDKMLLTSVISKQYSRRRQWQTTPKQQILPRKSSIAPFLKLFSSGDHFFQSECSTDHPTLVRFESKFIIFLNVLSIC